MSTATKVLIADDEKVVRHVCQLSLERAAFDVVLAENGLEAIEKLRQNQDIEIVLTDLKMPGLNGMELLQSIKRDFPHVEVIIMTGYATIEVAIDALKMGAYDFLLKPLKAEQIRLAVSKCRDKIQLSQENLELKQANEKLLELQLMKDKFIAITSHELRTPVSHLKGYLAILTDAAIHDLSEQEKADCMRVMQSAVGDLEQIVTDMMDLINLEHKLWSLRQEEVDLNFVINQVINEFKLAVKERRQELRWEARPQQCMIRADQLKIKVMVGELLQNAIKFTPDGGAIEIGLEEDYQFCVISVKDNGVGIDSRELGRIFEKFYEVQNTDYHSTNRTGFMGGGLGLGLSLARAIAEAHNGGIKVISKPRKGSIFQVFLPKTGVQKEVGNEK